MAVATACIVLHQSVCEVVAGATRHAAQDRKHKKQAAIAAKAALHEQVMRP